MAREKIELTIEGREGFVIVPAGLTDNEVIDFAVKNPDAFQQSAMARINDFGTQVAEVGTEFMGNAAAFPVSGVAGIAAGVNTVVGDGKPGDAARAVEGVQAKARELFGAKTGQGQQAMQTIAKNVPDVVRQAAQGFEDISQAAGDDTMRKTGSPALSAASFTVPTAIAELVTLGLFSRLKNGVRLLDEIGDATPEFREALNDVDLDIDSLNPEVRASLPVIMNDRLRISGDMDRAVEQVVKGELEAGSTKGGLSQFKLENGNVVNDVLGVNAVDQGYDPSYIQSVKTSNPSTIKQMDRMAKMMKALKQDRTAAIESRPSDIVGEAVKKDIDYLDNIITDRGQKLDAYTKSDEFKSSTVDMQPIAAKLETILNDLGVEYNPANIAGAKNYEASDIQFDKSAQDAIEDVISGLTSANLTPTRVHQLKRSFDKMINYKKKTMRIISPEGEKVVQSIRKELNQVLRNSSDTYARLNDDLSVALDATGEFDKSMKSVSLDGKGVESGVGEAMRKLLSKSQNRTTIRNALNKLNKTASDLGGKNDVDVGRLVLFSDMLDTRHGDVATRGFAQESAKGVQQGIEGALTGADVGLGSQAVTFAFNQASKGARKMRGKKEQSEKEAFEALRKLLQASKK